MRFKTAGSLLAVMAGALLLDRLTKAWAVQVLKPMAELGVAPGGGIALWPGVVQLRYAENTGAAFSLFAGGGWLLIAVTAVLLVLLAGYLTVRRPRGCMAWGMGLILAGGASNFYDRVAFGYVVDFVEPAFVRFAVFNLADVWVCAGVLLVAIAVLREERRNQNA